MGSLSHTHTALQSEFMRWWLEAKNGDGEGGALDAKLAEIAATGKKVHFVDVHTAAWKGDAEAVKTLLQRDASLARAEDETDYGVSLALPLPLVWRGLCASMGADPLGMRSPSGTEHTAALRSLQRPRGRVPGVAIGRRAGGRTERGTTALAAYDLSPSAMLTPSDPPQTGCTPMFFAAQQGHLEVVKLLKGRGASVTTKERSVVRSTIHTSCRARRAYHWR